MGFFKLTVALCLLASAASYVAESNKGAAQPVVEEEQFFPYEDCYRYADPSNTTNRNGVVPEQYRWPRGVIPYVLEPSVKDADLKIIKGGFELVMSSTCLRFVERTFEQNYLTIGTNKNGCNCAGLGMRGGPQYVNLKNPGCTYASTAAHEFLHAAGLAHEQSRADRDQFITVVWSNIKKDKHSQYERCDQTKYPRNEECSAYGQAYNVKSIMHYPGYGGFEINPKEPVMISNIPGVEIPRSVLDNNKLTAEDIAKINMMYNNCQ